MFERQCTARSLAPRTCQEELMEALLKPDVRLYLREVGIDITNAEFIFDVPRYAIGIIWWTDIRHTLE